MKTSEFLKEIHDLSELVELRMNLPRAMIGQAAMDLLRNCSPVTAATIAERLETLRATAKSEADRKQVALAISVLERNTVEGERGHQ